MAILARDIMQTKLITVPPDMLLSELADLFIHDRISGAPVVENRPGGPHVVGIVSRSDLVRFPVLEETLAGIVSDHVEELANALGSGDKSSELATTLAGQLTGHTVREVMATTPVSVVPTTPIKEVALKMTSLHLHRVLVMDGEDLVGIISSLDIARLVAEGTLSQS